jgi:HlyD family secretion protein
MIRKAIHGGALLTVLVTSSGCPAKESLHDASGVFEAREVIISAEVSGQLLTMLVEEGQHLEKDAVAAEIECKRLELQREQVQASEAAIQERTTEAKPQLEILREEKKAAAAQLAVQSQQLEVLERERQRFSALVDAQAAPAKQLADIEGQIAVLQRQIASTKSQVAIIRQRSASYEEQVALQNRATQSERGPTQAKIAEIDEQIKKCKVVNPLAGTVLTKYAEQFELMSPGKPLYRIADLSTIELRAYITGDQLAQVKLNQEVKVFVDDGANAYRELPGVVVWIAEKAEFTPKTIQTKSERSNLVYATKIRVTNDGTLKIGMYGEVTFERADR